MSSLAVRDAIQNFVETECPTEKYIDLSGQSLDMQAFMEANALTMDDVWLGVQFVSDLEEAVALNADNANGGYREHGVVYFHVVAPAGVGAVGRQIVIRSDSIRSKLRGRRFGSIIIENVSPTNTEFGATLVFDSGFMSGSFTADYYMDLSATP